jgi:hypothetical protein
MKTLRITATTATATNATGSAATVNAADAAIVSAALASMTETPAGPVTGAYAHASIDGRSVNCDYRCMPANAKEAFNRIWAALA